MALVHDASSFATSDSSTVCLFGCIIGGCFEHGMGNKGGALDDIAVAHGFCQCIVLGACDGEEEGGVERRRRDARSSWRGRTME